MTEHSTVAKDRPLTRGIGTELKLAAQTAPHVRLRMATAKRNIRCKAYTWAGHREWETSAEKCLRDQNGSTNPPASVGTKITLINEGLIFVHKTGCLYVFYRKERLAEQFLSRCTEQSAFGVRDENFVISQVGDIRIVAI